jgi:hypothetical protein
VHLVRAPDRLALQRHDAGLARSTVRGGSRGVGRLAQPALGEVGGVRISGGIPAHDADSRAAFTARREFFDLAVVEPCRRQTPIFGKDLSEVATVLERTVERALKNRLFDQHCLLRGCLS